MQFCMQFIGGCQVKVTSKRGRSASCSPSACIFLFFSIRYMSIRRLRNWIPGYYPGIQPGNCRATDGHHGIIVGYRFEATPGPVQQVAVGVLNADAEILYHLVKTIRDTGFETCDKRTTGSMAVLSGIPYLASKSSHCSEPYFVQSFESKYFSGLTGCGRFNSELPADPYYFGHLLSVAFGQDGSLKV